MNGVTVLGVSAKESSDSCDLGAFTESVWTAAQRATCAMRPSRSGGQQPSMQTSSVSPSCDSVRHKRISAFFSRWRDDKFVESAGDT